MLNPFFLQGSSNEQFLVQDLINEQLAGQQMYIARYYMKKSKWIAAIKRLNIIMSDYDTTIFAKEALHRLVEIYYILGLENEAKRYASLLGYNYQSSKWYENSYSVFDKNYNKNKIKKENNNILKRLKSLFK